MAKVHLTIDPNNPSDQTWEVEGVGGVACDEVTKAIEQTSEVIDKQHTAEYELPDVLPEYLTEGE